MGKGYFILLLLLFHSLVSMAQIPTKNYILGRQMLDANGVYAITTISSFDDLGLRNEQLLQANYYDNHAFINGQLEKQATSQNLVSNQQASEQYSKGSLTGTVCMATDGKPLVSVYYHDLRGQVLASKQTMPDDVLLSQNMTYSFTKQPLEIISELTKNGMSATVMQTNSYNKHNDKIETMTLKVGNVTRTVSSYSYNDISRLLVLGNLKCITFSNGFKTKYIYDAAGNKLRTTHESVVTNTTDYIGNFIFENGTIEPSHTFGVVGYVKEFDSYFNEVVSCPVFGKNNTDLEEKITIVEQ